MPQYSVNQGNRDYAIRMGCEQGVYKFVSDYARDMGISRSAAVRRLVLIGARCEGEHGQARMPASYASIRYDPSEIHDELHHPFEDEEEPEQFDWSKVD
jgi:hypothetical protein